MEILGVADHHAILIFPCLKDHFGESVAARYEDPADEMFEPAVIERAVAFLVDLAGAGAAREPGISFQVGQRSTLPPASGEPFMFYLRASTMVEMSFRASDGP